MHAAKSVNNEAETSRAIVKNLTRIQRKVQIGC